MLNIFKNSLKKGLLTRPIETNGVVIPEELQTIGCELKTLIYQRFRRSLHIREVDTGSCGACESEIIATTNPIYDIQRFGVDFVASPRQADALLVTGPVSRNMLLALKKTYEAMPEPKFIITLGECAFDGGAFKESYYVLGAVKDILPVVLHIPGCPPTPISIILHILSFLKNA